MKNFLFAAFALLVSGLQIASAQCDCPPLDQRTEVTISDAGSGTGTTTWTCDNTYLLDGYVFVNDGQALTIEPGTVIKGMAGAGADAAALIVARGGQLFAEGTADCPITFTHQADPLDGSVAYDLSGQWGGVIILGAAPTNLPTGEGQIEGVPADNDRAAYGGTNAADNSGVLSYVSIRHGGTTLAAANEINGLTLGGVGSGTTIHHVEVIANEDDGIEFFGGTVQINYAAVAFAGDDSFDWDQGFSGGGHHWFSINKPGLGDRGGELDGDDSPTVTANGQPFAIPTVTNWTIMGQGSAANKQGLLFRAGTGGHVSNVVIVGFGEGIELEDVQSPSDAFDKWAAGDLTLANFRMQDVNELIDYDGVAVADGDAQLDNYAAAQNMTLANVGVDNTWSTNASGTQFTDAFNPVPTSNVDASGMYPYMGAFDADGENWLGGWSYLDESGAAVTGLPNEGEGNTNVETCDCPDLADRTEVIISDAGQGTGTTTWTCDNTYLLDGYVFVNDGQALTIEPGTVIKGMAGAGADAAALIVARGGQIFAEGTESCPIIFTFEADPLDGSVAFDTRGQWGGVIILGAATTNLPTGEGQIEGVPADNDRAAYGGTNDADNSGVLSYVSIRHGGTTLAAANEINGLTLGGVGSGTTIDHIEIISNEDDGIEFFGGSVNVKHLLVAFAGDDSFDYDQGWHGKGQFWTAIQDPAVGDRAGEFDGDDSPTVTADGQPYAIPSLYNLTVVGRGIAANKQGFLFRAGAGGHLHNAIMANIAEAIELEDVQEPSDAFDKWAAGDLTLSNITMTAVGEAIDYDGSAVADGDAQLDSYAAANGIGMGDAGIDFEFGFNATGVAVTNPVDLTPAGDVSTTATAADAWFDAADYRGAFAPNSNWAAGWTYLDGIGFFSEGTTTVAGCTDPAADNYDASATVDDGSCIYLGCTDEAADNYDAQANEDDGSCVYSGCTDEAADNYDAAATTDDGSCLYTGCTDAAADNFDPQANTGDPATECQYNGCTSADAVNYDATANTDDGSCQFNVTFRVDMWNMDAAARIVGDFTAGAAVDMVWANYSLYKFTTALPSGTYTFHFETVGGTSEAITREIVVTGGMDMAAVCFDSFEACAGCTNAEFADFNPHAGEMTACEEAPVAGCTYADATNYDAAANVEDGTCAFELGSSCPGDLNDDGSIGTNDLLAFLAAFGTVCE